MFLECHEFDKKLEKQINMLGLKTMYLQPWKIGGEVEMVMAKDYANPISEEDATKAGKFCKEGGLNSIHIKNGWDISYDDLRSLMNGMRDISNLKLTLNVGFCLSNQEMIAQIKGAIEADISAITDLTAQQDVFQQLKKFLDKDQLRYDSPILSYDNIHDLIDHFGDSPLGLLDNIRQWLQLSPSSPTFGQTSQLQFGVLPVDLSTVDAMPNLKELWIMNSYVSGVTLQSLGRFTELTKLHVGQPDHSKTGGCSDDDLRHLANLKKLVDLSFQDNPHLTGVGFSALTELPLSRVHLFENGITTEGVIAISKLPSITSLTIVYNRTSCNNNQSLEALAKNPTLEEYHCEPLSDNDMLLVLNQIGAGDWPALQFLDEKSYRTQVLRQAIRARENPPARSDAFSLGQQPVASAPGIPPEIVRASPLFNRDLDPQERLEKGTLHVIKMLKPCTEEFNLLKSLGLINSSDKLDRDNPHSESILELFRLIAGLNKDSENGFKALDAAFNIFDP